MKTWITACAMVLVAAAGAAAQSESSVVVASGEGIVKAAPDQAWIAVASEARSRVPREAQQEAARAMTAVQEKLAAAGVPREAMRTIAYHLQPEFDWVNGRQIPRGYLARNAIDVRVDDVARVGELLDLVVGSGATSVQGLRFDLKAREAREREALRLAVADARARAEAMAAGAGRSIDRILRIEEPAQRMVYSPAPMAMAMKAEAQADTPVAPGEIEIRAQVTVTAALR
ncbi:MAG: SIMPL domain-containing protein [Acidobacteriota bacterium]